MTRWWQEAMPLLWTTKVYREVVAGEFAVTNRTDSSQLSKQPLTPRGTCMYVRIYAVIVCPNCGWHSPTHITLQIGLNPTRTTWLNKTCLLWITCVGSHCRYMGVQTEVLSWLQNNNNRGFSVDQLKCQPPPSWYQRTLYCSMYVHVYADTIVIIHQLKMG